jgi:hypothetical protein
MKKILLACAAVTLVLTACKNDPTQSEQYKELQTDKAKVAEESATKDSTINDMFGAFNRVSENLRMIREKQGLLKKGGQNVEEGKTME